MKRLQCCFIVLATLLMIIAALLIALSFLFDEIFMKLVYKQLVMSPESMLYKDWLEPSVPIYFCVYLYNLTNENEFLNGGKAKLEEVGPFVYRETRQRFDVNFSNEKPAKTVRYKQRIFYNFVPELSVASPENGIITTPDLARAGMVSNIPQFFGSLLSWTPFSNLSPQDAMWDYTIHRGSVGVFNEINGTSINEYVMDTGATDIQDIGKIYEANGATQLELWDNGEANMINGTDGSLAPPGMHVGSEFSIFVPDICRSTVLYAVNKTTTKNHNDVEAIVFSAIAPEHSKKLEKHRTEMFYKKGFPNPPKGLVSMESCLYAKSKRVPLYLSQPRFMGADPSIIEPFEGMKPANLVEHSTRMLIEPHTGLILEAYKRIQFNLYLDKSDNAFKNLNQSTYIPIAWLSEFAVAEKYSLDQFVDSFFRPKRLTPVITLIVGATVMVIAIGMIIALAVFSCCCQSRSSHVKVYPEYNSSSSDSCPDEGFVESDQDKTVEFHVVHLPHRAELSSKPEAGSRHQQCQLL